MLTLYDVAHIVAWNGYAEDMLPYLGVDKAAWTNQEFHFPYVANVTYTKYKKSRIQIICEEMTPTYDPKNYYQYAMAKAYDPVKRVKELLKLGAKPDIKDTEFGFTAFHICCRNGFPHHKEIAEILINAGVDVNIPTDSGWTGLTLASCNNNIHIVKFLLSNNAVVNHVARGKTPLWFACEKGNLEIVKLLVSKGGFVSDQLYEAAIDGGHIGVIKYLATIRPVPVNAISYAIDNNESSIATLEKLGADPNYIVNGETLVERSIWNNKHLAALLKAGADPNRTGTPNATPPIFRAVYLSDVECVKALSEKADVNILYHEDDCLEAPIHLAIRLSSIGSDRDRKDSLEIVKILIKKSDLTLQDWRGDTAIEKAQYSKLDDMVILMKRELLRRKGKKL